MATLGNRKAQKKKEISQEILFASIKIDQSGRSDRECNGPREDKQAAEWKAWH